MLDNAYLRVSRAVERLCGDRRVRRVAIAVCFLPNFALFVWNPPWFVSAYWHTSPFLLLGFCLILVDYHEWEARREVAARQPEARD